RVSLEPVQLLEISEVLALTQEPSEATRRVAALAGRFLPFDHLHFALRLAEGDRVVLLDPGERRALPDLASVPVAGTAMGEVLQGERPHFFALHQGEARLIVPLRVAGRVHGALVLTAAQPAVLNPAHLGAAQRVADVVAAYLELLRRAAMLPAPFHPGWKREHRR
ncbi:MAG TPA: GAF domain-containing protein, partial [Gemmatimonadales bacterium]|nr:GAF domain-containing protein [Gemmatimonadales bacterium]